MAKQDKAKNKPILRRDRQAKVEARNSKLDSHINSNVDAYIQNHYNDRKEARKQQRWYQTGEALKEADQKAVFDADMEFNEEFTEWAEKQQDVFHAQLDAEEQAMLEAEDDVIDVEVKPLPSRRQRKSLLGSGGAPQLGSSNSNLLPSGDEEVSSNSKGRGPSQVS